MYELRVCAGRLPGCRALALPASSMALHRRLFMTMPVSPGTMRDPKAEKTLWMSEIALPSPSATHR